MGRSVPTYRMKLEEMIAELSPYRRALREEDRPAFDALMNRARRYASAAGYQAAADPMETAVLSMLLGLEKEMEQVKGAMENGRDGQKMAVDGAKTIALGGDDDQKEAP
jgi:hypothetical protein